MEMANLHDNKNMPESRLVLIAACIMMAAAGVVLFVSILLAYGADVGL